ncbi:MAG: UbiX family flavin prenyltransferase [SAR324 cluster bacterium]|nr:UbiX family flavin prenyltransferase [SAR324 cluster bacterium]
MKRIIIGITGATGILYGIRILELLKKNPAVETHLILSKPAVQTLAYETDMNLQAIKGLADQVHSNEDIAASVSSGSFQTEAMIIAPCSMRTLSAIAHGHSDKLIARAADVILKERRRLILMVRETPLHYGHLQNMLLVTQMGAIVAPPVPAFYHRPQSIDDIVDHTVGRILDLIHIEHNLVARWKDPLASSQ